MSNSVSDKNKSCDDKGEGLARAQHFAADSRRTIDALIQTLRGESARPGDPHAVRVIADLEVRLHAAEAVLARAAQLATHDPASTDGSITIAAGKVLASEIMILAAEKLFELTGSRDGFSALDPEDALHEPIRWTFHAIGDVVVNGAQSPRHPRA